VTPIPLGLPRAAFLSLALLAGVYAARPAGAWPSDPTTGVAVSSATSTQYAPVTVADGAGGLFVAWQDHRAGNWDIYVMHQTRTGANSPGWPVNGLAVCNATDDQTSPVMAADNAGGVIVAWQDHRAGNWDIYAQHVTATGTVVSGWPANGLVVGAVAPNGVKDEITPRIVADGAGGAIFVWTLVFTPGSDNDIYAQRITAAGAIASNWPVGCRVVNTAGGIQDAPSICSDGAGGVIIAYENNVYGTYDIDAQHLGSNSVPLTDQVVDNASGHQVAPVVASDGAGGAFVLYQNATYNLACTRITSAMVAASGWYSVNVATNGPGTINAMQVVGDGSSGAYLTWTQYNGFDYDLGVDHILAGATLHPGWPVGGYLLPGGFSYSASQGARLVSDGAGGIIAAYGTFTGDLAATRLLANGSVAGGWVSGGTPVCNANGDQSVPDVASDGNGGALVAWQDARSGDYDIYAGRIEHFGRLGNPEPTLAGVKDVSNDQGGHVRVNWLPSYLDADPAYGVYDYVLYRQAPSALAQAAILRGTAAAVTPEATAAAPGAAATDGAGLKRYLIMPDAVATTYWEQVATVPAAELPAYSLVAATTGDSVAGSNPYTLFMVEAYGSGSGYWFSAPDSGYSADNLPPVAPAPFTGNYVASQGAFLNWGPNAEPDLAGYRLYRGSSPGFVPGPGNRVAAQATTGFFDVGAGPAFYKLSAVDVHGNESPFASLLPGGTTDAPGRAIPRVVFLAPVAPNPVRGAATMRFGLPQEADVQLALFDSQGRRLRVLMSGRQPAGEFDLRWDGRDDGGRPVASGLYFVRLQAGGRTLTQRLVTTR
jgi:hypothetical protein